MDAISTEGGTGEQGYASMGRRDALAERLLAAFLSAVFPLSFFFASHGRPSVDRRGKYSTRESQMSLSLSVSYYHDVTYVETRKFRTTERASDRSIDTKSKRAGKQQPTANSATAGSINIERSDMAA